MTTPGRLWRAFLARVWPLGGADAAPRQVAPHPPAPLTHVVLLDGTLSTLDEGHETSVGLIWKMLDDHGIHRVHYEPGLPWRGIRYAPEIVAGVGVNAQIRRAYAFLARAYASGDRVFLLGYSRGAYAVRALAGMIDRVGLLRPGFVSEALVQAAYEHYRTDPTAPAARAFRDRCCHAHAPIDAVGVFDTVQAVGVRAPVLWRVFPKVHAFRSHRLGQTVRHGFQALALHETRAAFRPEIWRTHGTRTETVEQVWFRGSHADIGGQVGRHPAARPLANLPLVWMLDRLSAAGLALPDGWSDGLPTDPHAPSVGNWRGFGPLFVARGRRTMGADPSESVHPSAAGLLPKGTGMQVWRDRPLPSAPKAPEVEPEGERILVERVDVRPPGLTADGHG